jgi:hypothetical protein
MALAGKSGTATRCIKKRLTTCQRSRDFSVYFPANALKTSSPPFSPSKADQRQVHKVAMTTFRWQMLEFAPYVFIWAHPWKNKKKSKTK